MDWKDLNKFIESQAKLGNPVAKSIFSLNLNENEIILNLSFCTNEKIYQNKIDQNCICDDNFNCQEIKIRVDLSQSALSNARRYYNKKKLSKVKQDKTKLMSKKAIKLAEKKSLKILQKRQLNLKLDFARQKYWFEKFFWFKTSEGLLAICGKDKPQSKMILNKMINITSDYLVGVENDPSSFVIVKGVGEFDDINIPIESLKEAGCIAISKSTTWKDRNVLSPFWIYSNQVTPSEKAFYSIKGQLNFLPHQILSFALTFYYKIPNYVKTKDDGNFKQNDNIDKNDDDSTNLETCWSCGLVVLKNDHNCKYSKTFEDLNEKGFENNKCFDILKSFVLEPNSNQKIEYAVPVCLSKTQIRKSELFFEFYPGSLTRGKAAKEIYGALTNGEKKNLDRKLEIIRNTVSLNDIVTSVVQNNVRVKK
ncbi:hypothetical protein MHBO_002697 [Bonamia ostreae]|uniref:LAGLIDADG homing endonuclease n=1 Tax=Bonamia ostreae TaxID=126728 RepID=A0ABV2ANN2_9EUKA